MIEKRVEKEIKIKTPKKFLKWIGGIFFIFGLIFLSVSFFVYSKTNSFLTTAVETQGRVVDLLRYENGYKPLVIFTDQMGREIEYVPNFSSNPPAYDIGEEVAVFYNPQTPQHAMLGGLVLYLLPVIFGIVGGVFAILGGIFIIIYRKGRTPPRKAGAISR